MNTIHFDNEFDFGAKSDRNFNYAIDPSARLGEPFNSLHPRIPHV